MSLCSPVMLKGLTKGRREKDVGLWRGKDDRRRELRETSEKREREKKQAITPSFATTLLSLASFRPRGAAARAIGF